MDARRRLSGDCLDIVRETVIAVVGVEAGQGLIPDAACITRMTLHKMRIASPIFVPPQARVRLHSDQRNAALIPDKTLCGAEDQTD